MSQDSSQTALIEKYENQLNEDPRSKVFAPLAELYRKLGLIGQAFQILKQGIRYNPGHTMGYLSLARCYLDQGEHQLAYSTLRPLVIENRENIKLQETYGKICLEMKYYVEALDVYKHLLFLSPKNASFMEQMNLLRDKVEGGNSSPSSSELNDDIVQFDVSQLSANPGDDDDIASDWVSVDLAADEEEEFDEWNLENSEELPELPANLPTGPSVQRDSFRESEPMPVMTLTLADLYIGQGYFDKAYELIQKIIELNGPSEKTSEKLKEIESLRSQSYEENSAALTEEEGRENLMGLFDQVSSQTEVVDDHQRLAIQNALMDFGKALRHRAEGLKR